MGNLRFGILGAGPGGQTMAAILASKGYSVKLMDIKEEVVRGIQEKGSIVLDGKMELSGTPDLVTTDPVEAVKDTDMILIVATCDAHEAIAEKIAGVLTADQKVLLVPGKFGGTLAFKSALKTYGCPYEIEVAETSDLPFSCRMREPGRIFHPGIKEHVPMASAPASHTQMFLDILQPIFPNLYAADNIWQFAMGSGCVLHCVPMIMNVNKMDLGESYDYYMQGITPSIAKIAEVVDKERLAVAKAFGIEDKPCAQWVAETYHVDAEGMYNVIQGTEAYRGVVGPSSLAHRFCSEDTYGSLAPLGSIAKELGIPTPGIDAVLFLIGAATGIDYTKEGRTAEKMGLKGKTVEEIYAMVK